MVRVKRVLDAVDLEIMRILSSNCREKLETIASKVGLSSPMVRKRIETLEMLGIIKGCNAKIDYALLGVSTYVIIIRHRASEKLVDSLHRHRLVERIYISRSRDTIVAIIKAQSEQELSDFKDFIQREAPGAEVVDIESIYEREWLPEGPGLRVIYRCGFCGGVIIGSPYVITLDERIMTFHGRECAEAYMQKKQITRL